MAVSPKDLALTDYELANAAAIENKVDRQLSQKFTVGNKGIDVDMANVAHGHLDEPRILNEVLRRFQAAGWQIDTTLVRTRGTWRFCIAP